MSKVIYLITAFHYRNWNRVEREDGGVEYHVEDEYVDGDVHNRVVLGAFSDNDRAINEARDYQHVFEPNDENDLGPLDVIEVDEVRLDGASVDPNRGDIANRAAKCVYAN